MCIATAYYGPNSHLFINIGSDFWGQKIEDISSVFYPMSILLTFDTVSIVVTSLCILKITNINILQEFNKLIGRYWLIMAVKLSFTMASYFGGTDVNWGMDATAQWITQEGRLSLIYNTTYLTDEEKSLLLGNTTLI